MEQVLAYKASDGSLHSEKADAAHASILSMRGKGGKKQPIFSGVQATYMIEERADIIALLTSIDAP